MTASQYKIIRAACNYVYKLPDGVYKPIVNFYAGKELVGRCSFQCVDLSDKAKDPKKAKQIILKASRHVNIHLDKGIANNVTTVCIEDLKSNSIHKFYRNLNGGTVGDYLYRTEMYPEVDDYTLFLESLDKDKIKYKQHYTTEYQINSTVTKETIESDTFKENANEVSESTDQTFTAHEVEVDIYTGKDYQGSEITVVKKAAANTKQQFLIVQCDNIYLDIFEHESLLRLNALLYVYNLSKILNFKPFKDNILPFIKRKYPEAKIETILGKYVIITLKIQSTSEIIDIQRDEIRKVLQTTYNFATYNSYIEAARDLARFGEQSDVDYITACFGLAIVMCLNISDLFLSSYKKIFSRYLDGFYDNPIDFWTLICLNYRFLYNGLFPRLVTVDTNESYIDVNSSNLIFLPALYKLTNEAKFDKYGTICLVISESDNNYKLMPNIGMTVNTITEQSSVQYYDLLKGDGEVYVFLDKCAIITNKRLVTTGISPFFRIPSLLISLVSVVHYGVVTPKYPNASAFSNTHKISNPFADSYKRIPSEVIELGDIDGNDNFNTNTNVDITKEEIVNSREINSTVNNSVEEYSDDEINQMAQSYQDTDFEHEPIIDRLSEDGYYKKLSDVLSIIIDNNTTQTYNELIATFDNNDILGN